MKLAALVSLSLVACTFYPLRPDGAAVRVVNDADVAQCVYIGPTTARVELAFEDFEGNLRYAHNVVRNQASELGATDVVLNEPAHTSDTTVALTGMAYRCPASDNASTSR